MTKFYKLIAVLFCFAITFIVFKDGIPEYNPSKGYAGYIAALVLFIVGVVLLINIMTRKVKPMSNYKEYIKNLRSKKHSDDLESVEQNIKLLEQSYNDGILDRDEFKSKMNHLKDTKDRIRSITKSENEFHQKKETLLKLYENKIITKDEFGEKINTLRSELQLDSSDCADPTIDDETKVYFISDCAQHGPLPISYVVYLLQTKQINPNCFYKLQGEDSYSHRVRELPQKLAS